MAGSSLFLKQHFKVDLQNFYTDLLLWVTLLGLSTGAEKLWLDSTLIRSSRTEFEINKTKTVGGELVHPTVKSFVN